MGCVTSKHRLRDSHQNIFNVMNVNDNGQIISPGQLEVTETELILHQRGKEPTRWPLSFLRKYGCDSELFTFECGRRCPTGQGIYAFRCRKAEQLFNLLQRNLNTGSNVPHHNLQANGAIHLESAMGSLGHRHSSQPEGYLNPISNTVVTRAYPTLSRPGSMNSSNGQVSPSAVSPPPSANELIFEHNNNKRGSLIPEHAYTNASAIAETDNAASYINVTTLASPTLPVEHYINLPEVPSHVYMNVSACETPNLTKDMSVPNLESELIEHPISEIELDAIHCYENIGLADLNFSTNNESNPHTPTTNIPREVNYVQLDLESTTPKAKPESPKVKNSYAMIDIVRSKALSQSINNRTETEEGSRKTRHNASIPETSTAKHRSSLSD